MRGGGVTVVTVPLISAVFTVPLPVTATVRTVTSPVGTLLAVYVTWGDLAHK